MAHLSQDAGSGPAPRVWGWRRAMGPGGPALARSIRALTAAAVGTTVPTRAMMQVPHPRAATPLPRQPIQ
eukprot:12668976-Alexandrium_andersonii.AAC.1